MGARGAILVGVTAVVAVAAMAIERGGAAARGAVDALVPADAQLLVRVDVASARRMWLEPLMGPGHRPAAGGGMWGDAALEAEVRALLVDRLGVHVHDVDRVTGVMGAKGAWGAALLEGDFEGRLKADARGVSERDGMQVVTLEGGQIEAVFLGDVLVIGSPTGLDAIAAVQRGRVPSLAAGSEAGQNHAAAAEALGVGSGVIATMHLGNVDADKYDNFTGGGALRGAGFAMGPEGDLQVVAIGDAKAVEAIERQAKAGLDLAVAGAIQHKEQIVDGGDTLEALGAIVATHQLRQLRDLLVIERSGDAVSLRLEGVGATLPLLGVASATAVPAYLKYIERARAAQEKYERIEREREERLRDLDRDRDPAPQPEP